MQAQAGTVMGGSQLRRTPYRPRSISERRVGSSSRQRSNTSCGGAQSRPMTRAREAIAPDASRTSVSAYEADARRREGGRTRGHDLEGKPRLSPHHGRVTGLDLLDKSPRHSSAHRAGGGVDSSLGIKGTATAAAMSVPHSTSCASRRSGIESGSSRTNGGIPAARPVCGRGGARGARRADRAHRPALVGVARRDRRLRIRRLRRLLPLARPVHERALLASSIVRMRATPAIRSSPNCVSVGRKACHPTVISSCAQ
jgi:hypothetical protein